MPSEKRVGKKGIYVELPEDLEAEFREFCRSFPLGTITQHVQLAIRRHMANPPRVETPPLPDVIVPSGAAMASGKEGDEGADMRSEGEASANRQQGGRGARSGPQRARKKS